MKKIYAVYDTVGIQSYIFASNKLRENKGASELAGRVLKQYLPDVLTTLQKEYGAHSVIKDWETCLCNPLAITNSAEIKAEIIYIGGGNAYVAFDSLKTYQDVTKAFLFKVYDEAPGIGIATAFIDTDFTGNYAADYKLLHANLAISKSKLNRPVPAGNQPITKASPLTGLPTVKIENGEFLSADQVKKRETRNSTINKQPGEKFLEFSEIKRENDFICVIHADGNSMAKLIEKYADTADWKVAVPRIRKMSHRISTLYAKALEKTKEDFQRFYEASTGNANLPFINIIADGDDITCVVAGQYGISFAANLLRNVEELNNDEDAYPFPDWNNVWPGEKPPATACAGAVIFHSHYPFSAAYEMAEACCANAKRYTRTAKVVGSFIDFHLHSSGTVANLKQFRKEQYTARGENEAEEFLLYRPYCVSTGKDFPDKYPPFLQFEKLMAEWASKNDSQIKGSKPWPRSRQKALRNALSKGSTKVNDVITWCESRGYVLPEEHKATIRPTENDNKQKISDYALLFDVLELADMYIQIHDKEVTTDDSPN